MSGGYFDYKQYSIKDIADQVESLILNKSWDNEYTNVQDKEGFKTSLEVLYWHLKVSYIMAHRLDWFLSGDDSEESYFKRLRDELDTLFNSKLLDNIKPNNTKDSNG